MNELHNMSVPPRTTLTIRSARLAGTRYRIDLAKSVAARRVNTDRLRRLLPKEGAACLLNTVDETRTVPPGQDAASRVRELCLAAVRELRLPDGLGFFVHEPDMPEDVQVPAAAAVALLAARSGPLYVPGRFEPSLITIEPATLFFPEPSEESCQDTTV